MTGQDVLEALLARIADSIDGVVYLSEEELSGWPRRPVDILKTERLLSRATPGTSATCDGCERRCHMPVEVLGDTGEESAFIFCDKPIEVGRVEVPLARLSRWQTSGRAVADFLASRLDAHGTTRIRTEERQWAVGFIRGTKRSAPAVVSARDSVVLDLAGHSVRVEEILSLTVQGLVLERSPLEERIDNPKPGGPGEESPRQRRQRYREEIEIERAKGNLAPVATVAARERITRQMVHKVTKGSKKTPL
jgi:hypothetical protein